MILRGHSVTTMFTVSHPMSSFTGGEAQNSVCKVDRTAGEGLGALRIERCVGSDYIYSRSPKGTMNINRQLD